MNRTRAHPRSTVSLVSIVFSIGRCAGELAVACALLVGWLLVTLAVARLLRGDVVWPLSLGLLLFSAAGWRLFGAIALHGLYALSKDPPMRNPRV